MRKPLVIEGKKYMSDQATYPRREAAELALGAYEKEGFETRVVEEDGQFFLYTRRVAAPAAAPG